MTPEEQREAAFRILAENQAVLVEGLSTYRTVLEAHRSGDRAAIDAAEKALSEVNERARQRIEASKLMIADIRGPGLEPIPLSREERIALRALHHMKRMGTLGLISGD